MARQFRPRLAFGRVLVWTCILGKTGDSAIRQPSCDRLFAGLRRSSRLTALAAALGFAGALGLAACGGGAPSATFDLSALPPGGTLRGSARQLVVAEPVAGQALDSDRIVIRPAEGEIAYLSGAQWADRLPRLVQTRLIQSFENTRTVKLVGRPGDRLAADRTLETEIRAFEINVRSGEAVVEITAKLLDDRSGRLVATQVFGLRAPSGGTGGRAATAALDGVLAQVMRAIAVWTAARL